MSGATPRPEAAGSWPDRHVLALAGAAAASFLPCLFYYYVGEEGLYTIAAMQMQASGDFLVPVVPGGNYGRPPFLIWLIVLIAKLVGWDNVLIASRIIAVTATVLTAAATGWFARALLGDRSLAAFAVVIQLTFLDVLFYRGWLAYSDPLFALLVFGAIACTWTAAKRHAYGLLLGGLFLVSCAFLTKALTAYAFYVLALGVLSARAEYRRFLAAPPALALYLAAMVVPLIWVFGVSDSAGPRTGMVDEITRRFAVDRVSAYIGHLLAFPAELAVKLSLPVLLAGLCSWRTRHQALREAPHDLRLALWILALGFIPYWLLPYSHTRYLLPLTPLAAVACAWILARSGGPWLRAALTGALAVIALKYVLAVAVFPWYQQSYRGANYLAAAHAIIGAAAGHPLYNTDNSASGASVTAYIDSLRFPAAPLQAPPAGLESGFILAHEPDAALGRTFRTFRLGGNDLYLLCRGAACAK